MRIITPNARHFFDSPAPAGRIITAGFTYVQRISKAASYDVWFPDELKQQLDARIAAGQSVGSQQFPVQWAAVRQFELLHESGNHKIYDLDPSNFKRATLDLSKSMRAGGYRVAVATLGCYAETSTGDELEILDRRLQKRIAQMIHMLYLDTQSDEVNAKIDKELAASTWDYREQLPHVGMVLGAQDLFQRIISEEQEEEAHKKKGGKTGSSGTRSMTNRKLKQAQHFFHILNQLPQSHILHDTAIGLQLPELNGEHQWNYVAASDETLDAFNRVLNDVFDKFNHLSLGRLHEREDATAEIKSSTVHLRGYGDHLNDRSHFYRRASLALN